MQMHNSSGEVSQQQNIIPDLGICLEAEIIDLI